MKNRRTISAFASASLLIILLLNTFLAGARPLKPEKVTDTGSPVNLTSFNVRPSRKVITLEWSTARETNAYHFILQRSTDGKQYAEIAVIVTGDDSNTTKNYQFIDERGIGGNPAVYYRLKIVDRDGQYVYSDVKTFSRSKMAELHY